MWQWMHQFCSLYSRPTIVGLYDIVCLVILLETKKNARETVNKNPS